MRRLLFVSLLCCACMAEESVKPPLPPGDDDSRIIDIPVDKKQEPIVKEIKEPRIAKASTRQLPKSYGKFLDDLLKLGEIERQDRLKLLRSKSGEERDAEEKYLRSQKDKYLPTLTMTTGSVGVFRSLKHSKTIDAIFQGDVSQIVSENEMIVKINGQDIWMIAPTTNISDGDRIELDLFKYVGNKQYKTVLGSTRTLQCIERVTK